MSVLRGLLYFAILTVVTVVSDRPVVAAPVTADGQLHVQARVLPAHTMLVDERDEIMQIASNTAEDVAKPRVYRGSINTGNEQPLTQSLYNEYRRLVPLGQSRVGILYDHSSAAYLLQVQKFSLLPAGTTNLLTLR